MKSYLALALASAAMLATSAAALAQDARSYDNGPVWDVEAILTKPGHFDDYMKFVSTSWRAEQEAAKAKGLVLDYKVLAVTDPRENGRKHGSRFGGLIHAVTIAAQRRRLPLGQQCMVAMTEGAI